MEGKSVSSSGIEMNELVLPNDTNLLGNLLGGRLMHWMDIAGGMAASRHSNSIVVTVGVDSLDFKHPIRLGDIVRLKARLTWVGQTSIEVKIEVCSENFETKEIELTNQAYFVYVALDHDGKPKPVPPLILKTEDERQEFEAGKKRRELRLASR